MDLDYKYTCPLIDVIRDDAKNQINCEIQEALGGILHDDILNPLYDKIKDIIHSMADDFRTINSDMRDAAGEQLSKIDSDVKDLKEEISRLEYVIDGLEEQIFKIEG